MKAGKLNNLMLYKRQFLIAFGLIILSISVFAQAASPYSRYGLGYVRSSVFSANAGMGGVAAPYASLMHINTTNPASYASLSRTTIEAGFNVDGTNIRTNDSIYKTVNGNINHIAFAFVPKPDKFAIVLGLLPYTNINYTFVQNITSADLGTFRYAYAGKGSLYNVFAGGAYKIKSRINELDNFSIGVNVGYIFGKLNYQKLITFPDSIGAYSTRNLTMLNANSFSYSVGLQYRRRIYHNTDVKDERTDIYFTAGAYASGGVKLNAKMTNYWDRFQINVNTGQAEAIDTQNAVYNQKSKITMPVNVGGGVMFGNERYWMVGTDFKYANWSSYDSPLDNDQLKDSWRLSAGFQITPKYDERKYFGRIQYRFGGYYGKSEMQYNGTQLYEAGGTVGLGFPFKLATNTGTMLNISADFGSRGCSDPNAITETYYRLTFGFVLNDGGWFFKRKFD